MQIVLQTRTQKKNMKMNIKNNIRRDYEDCDNKGEAKCQLRNTCKQK